MTIDRRHFLAGTGAALSAPVFFSRHARAAVPPFRRKVGAIEVVVISDGTLSAPLSFTLPETPPQDSAALLTAHGLPPGGMPSQANVTLVKSGSETVLIDAGSGGNWQPTAGKLAENMEAAGIDPASVTKVVFTHGHADHLWGAIDEFDEQRFPNASYVMSVPEWDFWTNPGTPNMVPDYMKGMALGSARILKRIEGKTERRKAGDTVAPGLTYAETIGHSPGHMAVLVDGGERLLIGGDVLTHPAVSFAKPDWRMGADHDKDRAIAVRRRTLDRLAADRMPFVGFHLPWPGHGMVEPSGTAYRFVPV